MNNLENLFGGNCNLIPKANVINKYEEYKERYMRAKGSVNSVGVCVERSVQSVFSVMAR